MSEPSWDDVGPISQGRIITAILRGQRGYAADMLHGWSTEDLIALAKAATVLEMLCLQEQVRKRPLGGR